MKKLFVLFLCLLALFAVVSCENEPSKEPKPTPDPTPAEPEWESGVLVVSPAEGSTFSQNGKFQFKMAVNYSVGDTIAFKLKCSDDITGVEAREGGNGDTFFIPQYTALNTWEQDDDGWYIISIPAESVVPVADPCLSLGITARLPNDNRSECYVAIKDMKISDVLVDFTEYVGEETSLISAYVTSPNNLDVYIEE